MWTKVHHHTRGTVSHFGRSFPPNGKHYVYEWVQRTTVYEKLYTAQTIAVVKSHWAAAMKDKVNNFAHIEGFSWLKKDLCMGMTVRESLTGLQSKKSVT